MKNISQAKSKTLKMTVFSVVILLLYCAAVLAASYFCWKHNVLNCKAEIVFYIIWVACVILSAFFYAAASSSKGWLNGIIGAFVFMGGAFLLNYLISKGECDLLSFAVKLPLFVLLGLICGIFGINFRK